MKFNLKFAVLTVASLVTAGTSFAQSNGVVARVPFAFAVGDKVLPAGTYTVSAKSSQVLEIRNHDQGTSAFSLSRPDSRKSGGGGKLVFHKYAGDRYFLSEILCDAAEMNVQLFASKREKRAQVQEAWLHTNSEVLVAAR